MKGRTNQVEAHLVAEEPMLSKETTSAANFLTLVQFSGPRLEDESKTKTRSYASHGFVVVVVVVGGTVLEPMVVLLRAVVDV